MIWKGRYDGDDVLHHRLFQRVITGADYRDVKPNDFVLHGFAVDEGVRRNKGRVGAAEAPDIIKTSMANFPVVQPNFVLYDFGNVECVDQQLEESQESLAKKVGKAVSAGARSIVVGGGHEVMHAHFSGLRKAYPHKKIGIINFDAHFDNRSVEPNVGPSSGTGFWQIAQQETLHSLHIGIQRNSNTLQLFDSAHQLGMQYILADELFFENLPSLYIKVDDFLENVDFIYITVCMDVFNAAVAPGVSAAAYNGIFADAAFMHLYRHLLSSTKVRALDVAEVNPSFDIQNQTARLAASLVNEWLMI